MELTEITYHGQPPIDGYGPGFFRVQDQPITGPLILGPQGRVPWAGYSDPETLIATGRQVDVLLIGTGDQLAFLPDPLEADLASGAIAFELMASPAAARSYNILLAEGRRVAIAALPIDALQP